MLMTPQQQQIGVRTQGWPTVETNASRESGETIRHPNTQHDENWIKAFVDYPVALARQKEGTK